MQQKSIKLFKSCIPSTIFCKLINKHWKTNRKPEILQIISKQKYYSYKKEKNIRMFKLPISYSILYC